MLAVSIMRRAIVALLAGILLSAQMPGPPGFPPGVFSNRGAIDAPASSALACSNTSPVQVADNGLAYIGSTPSASGGTPTYTFTLTSGSLVATGLSLSSSTGQITGTPSSAGTISGLRISVTDLALSTTTCGASFNIVVAATLTLTYSPVTTATQGSLYTGATPSISGGTGTITYSSTGTAPPTGITLTTSTGIFSGTPTGSGTTTGIILTATDACNCSGNQTSSSSSFSIVVSPSGTAMKTPIISGEAGSGTAPSTSVINYGPLLGGNGGTQWTSTVQYEVPWPIAGSFSNLAVNLPTGSTGSYIVQTTLNGSGSGPTCTASTGSTCADNSNTLAVTAGQTVGIEFNPNGTTPTSNTYVQWGVLFTSTNNNEGFVVGDGQNAGQAAQNWASAFGNGPFVATNDTQVSNVMAAAGTLDHLYVVINAAPGAGKTWAVSVYQNGSSPAGTLTCSMTGTGSGAGITTCSDLSDSIAISQGDTISVSVTPTGTPAVERFAWGMRWQPTTAGQSLMAMTCNCSPGTAGSTYFNVNGYASALSSTEAHMVMLSPGIGGSGFSMASAYGIVSTAPGGSTARTMQFRSAETTTQTNPSCAFTTGTTCTGGTAWTGITAATLIDWHEAFTGTPAGATWLRMGAVMTVP